MIIFELSTYCSKGHILHQAMTMKMQSLRHCKHLKKFTNINRHFVNPCTIKSLKISELLHFFIGDKINCHPLSTKTTRSPNPVNIKFSTSGQIIANYHANLLHINTSTPDV